MDILTEIQNHPIEGVPINETVSASQVPVLINGFIRRAAILNFQAAYGQVYGDGQFEVEARYVEALGLVKKVSEYIAGSIT